MKFRRSHFKSLAVAALMMAALCFSQTTVPVTGHFTGIDGTVPENTFVRFTLVNCGANMPREWDVGSLVETVKAYVPIGGDGSFTGTIRPNSIISCGGTTGNTRYSVQFILRNVPKGPALIYNIPSGATFNLDTAVAIGSLPPPNLANTDFTFSSLTLTSFLNLQGAFQVGGNPGLFGQCFVSSGAGAAPHWTPCAGGGTVSQVSGDTLNGFVVTTVNPTSDAHVRVNVDGSHYLPTSTDVTRWNNPALSPGGSNGAIQINNNGALGGLSATASSQVAISTPASGNPFAIRQLTMDDILPAFDFTSFTCSTCGTYERGATVASPTNFTAAFSSAPTSASVSDGTHTNPLTSPFTSGSLAYSYSCATTGTNVTFTYSATAATTKTRNGTINCQPRTFYGVGTGGATGATASGNNAVLAGATGTLGTWGLGTNTGTVSASPAGQYIYFLLSTGGHTFKVNGFTTTFSCSSITFTNQNSAAVPMQQCVSPASLTGAYTVEVN